MVVRCIRGIPFVNTVLLTTTWTIILVRREQKPKRSYSVSITRKSVKKSLVFSVRKFFTSRQRPKNAKSENKSVKYTEMSKSAKSASQTITSNTKEN